MGIKEMTDVMLAYYENEETIEQKDETNPFSEWEFVEVPQWNWQHYSYRIRVKPIDTLSSEESDAFDTLIKLKKLYNKIIDGDILTGSEIYYPSFSWSHIDGWKFRAERKSGQNKGVMFAFNNIDKCKAFIETYSDLFKKIEVLYNNNVFK